VVLKVLSLNTPNQVKQKTLTIHETVEKSWGQFGHACFICGFTPGNYSCLVVGFSTLTIALWGFTAQCTSLILK